MINDFLSLIFPKACAACGESLLKLENSICTYCLYHLPKTNFHLYTDNPVIKLFWGRTTIFSAASLYSFKKAEKVQRLIHQLKYRGKKEIGTVLGNKYGIELKASPLFSTATLVMPVPLHSKKLKRRGYNQSETFAQGLAEAMEIESSFNNLIRKEASASQTKQSRFERWENVKDAFEIVSPEKLQGKHILLVDDVVTTGSTLEACANKILEVENTKVSIATIAYALR